VPLTASKATLAFCEPVKIFRVFPLIFNLDFRIGYTLNYCPDFGVHYRIYKKVGITIVIEPATKRCCIEHRQKNSYQ
ncbi:MAG: hypothetical protein Q8L68_02055, partial [Methylococcales bacterium]|nr:hypothetical protein [Methylococcales bacterium]